MKLCLINVFRLTRSILNSEKKRKKEKNIYINKKQPPKIQVYLEFYYIYTYNYTLFISNGEKNPLNQHYIMKKPFNV